MFPNVPSYSKLLLNQLRHFHNKPESTVIAAAVRTPWGKYQGQLSSLRDWQLGQLAAETAVKQSSIPLEQIQSIYMNEAGKSQRASQTEFIYSDFLKKAKYTPITVENCDDLKAIPLLKALESLQSQQQQAVVVGGFESATQSTFREMRQSKESNNLLNDIKPDILENYFAQSAAKYSEAQNKETFASELVTLKVPQEINERRVIKEINQDELFSENYPKDKDKSFEYGEGAAALVLTTFRNAQELNLSPLAFVLGFEHSLASMNIFDGSRVCLEKLLSKLKLNAQQIRHWEIEDYNPELVAFLKHNFKLKMDSVNPHGGSLILGHSPAASLARLVVHLSHSLKPLEYGCVISSSLKESLAMIIQKLPFHTLPDRLPLVTLYTKEPCPLCDTLVEELELHYHGEYELKKIFINTKDNLRFLRLYRHDIPVVFLNNQFLCMHRLNRGLFKKRLELLKKYDEAINIKQI